MPRAIIAPRSRNEERRKYAIKQKAWQATYRGGQASWAALGGLPTMAIRRNCAAWRENANLCFTLHSPSTSEGRANYREQKSKAEEKTSTLKIQNGGGIWAEGNSSNMGNRGRNEAGRRASNGGKRIFIAEASRREKNIVRRKYVTVCAGDACTTCNHKHHNNARWRRAPLLSRRSLQ